MTRLARISGVPGFLGDRMNPIVVREARQAVRSKAVFAALWLLLIALVGVTGTFALLSDATASASEARGDDLFAQVNGVVMVLCVVFVPIYTAWRFAGEHTGARADLLHTTTVKPSSIVWGKLVVALMVALLMFSAAAPFLTLTYLFRGIDLATILFVVCIDLVGLLVAAQAGVFIAAMRISAGLRIIIGILALPAALWIIATGTTLILMEWISVVNFDADDWIMVGSVVAAVLAIGGLMFCMSVAITAPATTNRARLPRIYLTVMWAASLGVAVFAVNRADRFDSVSSWCLMWSVVNSLSMLFAGSERRQLGPRLLRSIPRFRPLRVIAFLYTSGAAGGLLWAVCLQCLSGIALVVVWSLQVPRPTMYGADTIYSLVLHYSSIPCFTLAYILGAAALRDSLARRLSPGTTAPMAMFAAAMFSIVPLVTASLINPRGWDRDTWYYFANPLGAMFARDYLHDSQRIALFGLIAAVLVSLSMFGWFRHQIRAFRPAGAEADAALTPESHGR